MYFLNYLLSTSWVPATVFKPLTIIIIQILTEV